MDEMLDFANLYPSLWNLVEVGLMSTIFIIVMKWLTNRYSIPGVSAVFASI